MNEIPMTNDEKQKVQMLREMVEYRIGIPETLKILRDAKGNENAALDEILSITSGELNQSRQISAPSPVRVSPVVPQPEVPNQDLELELMRQRLEEQKREEKKREEEELRKQIQKEEEERREREQLEIVKRRIEEEKKRKEELELQRQLLEDERRKVERDRMELELIRREELFRREEEKRKQEEEKKRVEEERIRAANEEELRLQQRRIKEEEEAAEYMRQAALKKRQEEEAAIAAAAAAAEKEKREEEARLAAENAKKQPEVKVVEEAKNNNNSNNNNNDSLAFIREAELTRSRMGMFNLEPIVLIYFRPAQENNILVNPQAQAKNLTEIFTNLGVQPFGIQVADISTDFELGSYLKSCFPEEPNLFPFICIHRKPVGNYTKIKQLQNDGTLMTYINSPDLIPDLHRETFSYRQDVMDKALDAAEYLITNTLYIPYSILTWPFGGKAKENAHANSRNTDIPVVHHNWYSRGTKRLLRFSSESISRIHPSYPDQVRAEHKYADVENVSFPSEKYDFVIKYLDGVADYYTCSKADLEIVREIVRTKCKDNANFTSF